MKVGHRILYRGYTLFPSIALVYRVHVLQILTVAHTTEARKLEHDRPLAQTTERRKTSIYPTSMFLLFRVYFTSVSIYICIFF